MNWQVDSRPWPTRPACSWSDLRALTESMRGRTLDAARDLVERSPLPADVTSALLKLLSDLEVSA
jgi:hypothetical protein